MGGKAEERSLIVVIGRSERYANLEVWMSRTVEIFLDWRIIVKILVLSDCLRLLDIIVPIVPVCTARQHERTE